jgi:hypothetical protein
LLEERLAKVRSLRQDLGEGRASSLADLANLAATPAEPVVAFELPWPWGGERFELRVMRRLNFVTGPLGSGKLRLAQALAEHLPGAGFLGLDRLDDDGAHHRARMAADPALRGRVQAALAWLLEEDAVESGALLALIAALQAEAQGALIIDMVEQGLDEATQAAVAAWLRRHHPAGRPLFLFTRSSTILDLEAMGPDETLILCPANHSPPVQVEPYPGAASYDSVATCLAPPSVRARTAGLFAARTPLSA